MMKLIGRFFRWAHDGNFTENEKIAINGLECRVDRILSYSPEELDDFLLVQAKLGEKQYRKTMNFISGLRGKQ